jgi:hypothetical protein
MIFPTALKSPSYYCCQGDVLFHRLTPPPAVHPLVLCPTAAAAAAAVVAAAFYDFEHADFFLCLLKYCHLLLRLLLIIPIQEMDYGANEV